MQLRTSTLFWSALTVVAMCSVGQVILGADPLVLALAVLACAAGLAGFRLAGAYTVAGWLAFFFILGNVLIALVAKTLLVQALDSRLYAPLDSFLVLTAGSIEMLFAVAFALTVPVGKPIFRPLTNLQLLAWLSNWTFVLGMLLWFLDRLSQDPEGSGFGGFGVFWNLLLMAVIARTALILERTGGRRSIDTRLAAILVACVAVGIIDNSKTHVALPIVSYFATSLFFRQGLALRQLAVGIFGLAVLATLISPLIHAFRALGIQEVSWTQRVALIERGVVDLTAPGQLQRYEQLAAQQFTSGYYDYFGDGSGQMVLGRYASIQQIDPVIARVSRQNALGGSVIWPAFSRLLPSFIFPDKPRYIESYGALVRLGLIDPEGGKYPTVPLLAQSYAGYGTVGLLLIPLFAFIAMLLALKKLGWTLYRNVFGIFFFCVFVPIYANQGDLGQYAGSVLRNFPLLGAVLWLLIHAFQGRAKRSLRRVLPPSGSNNA